MVLGLGNWVPGYTVVAIGHDASRRLPIARLDPSGGSRQQIAGARRRAAIPASETFVSTADRCSATGGSRPKWSFGLIQLFATYLVRTGRRPETKLCSSANMSCQNCRNCELAKHGKTRVRSWRKSIWKDAAAEMARRRLADLHPSVRPRA